MPSDHPLGSTKHWVRKLMDTINRNRFLVEVHVEIEGSREREKITVV